MSAFAACLARSRVCFDTVPSVASLRSVSCVGHGGGSADFPFRICVANKQKKASLTPNSERRGHTVITSSTHLLQTRISGDTSLPTLGGASRAPGLPQAAAWHICRRSPHPLREESRTTTGKPLSRTSSACVPLFGWEPAPLRGIWAAFGLSVRRPRGAPLSGSFTY